MDIISVALKRHSTKAFDLTKKLTAEEAEKIKTLLQYSPSSTNSQPWHFIVASTEEGKARVAKSAAGRSTRPGGHVWALVLPIWGVSHRQDG